MKKVPALVPVLAAIFVTFIGILIYVWVESKKANPRMLDEQGREKHGRLERRIPRG